MPARGNEEARGRCRALICVGAATVDSRPPPEPESGPVESAPPACQRAPDGRVICRHGSPRPHAVMPFDAAPAAPPTSLDEFLASVERRAFRMAELALGHRED